MFEGNMPASMHVCVHACMHPSFLRLLWIEWSRVPRRPRLVDGKNLSKNLFGTRVFKRSLDFGRNWQEQVSKSWKRVQDIAVDVGQVVGKGKLKTLLDGRLGVVSEDKVLGDKEKKGKGKKSRGGEEDLTTSRDLRHAPTREEQQVDGSMRVGDASKSLGAKRGSQKKRSATSPRRLVSVGSRVLDREGAEVEQEGGGDLKPISIFEQKRAAILRKVLFGRKDDTQQAKGSAVVQAATRGSVVANVNMTKTSAENDPIGEKEEVQRVWSIFKQVELVVICRH